MRFRTYVWFPVLTVGTALVLTLALAAGGDSGPLVMLLFVSLPGLYVSALLGVHGLFRDAEALAAAEADWRPSWRGYVAAVLVVAAVLTALSLVPPVSLPDGEPLGPVGLVGLVLVSLSIATGPVCLTYLLVRGRRVGLNYLKL
jgi:hypothetical protein